MGSAEKLNISHLNDLSGQTAVVTGGGTGIGQSMCIGLAKQGADVVVTGRTLATLENTKKKVEECEQKCLAVTCDVTDPRSVKELAARVEKEVKKVDILIANAGLAIASPAEDMPLDVWKKVIDTNLTGAFLTCQAFGRIMIKNKTEGRILLTSSIRGVQAHPWGYSAYATSKAAVNMLTRQLSCEWAKYRIRVNAIAPCITWTPKIRDWLDKTPRMKDYFMSRLLMKEAPETEDMIGATVFLFSAGSRFVTGQILYVDAGNSVW